MIVFQSTQDKINENWDNIKCTPIGSILHFIGLAPDESDNTDTQCKANAFSAMFNASMSQYNGVLDSFNENIKTLQDSSNVMKNYMINMQKQAYHNLLVVADKIMALVQLIENLLYLVMKNISNLLNVFKYTIGTATNILNLFSALINQLRGPLNKLLRL